MTNDYPTYQWQNNYWGFDPANGKDSTGLVGWVVTSTNIPANYTVYQPQIIPNLFDVSDYDIGSWFRSEKPKEEPAEPELPVVDPPDRLISID